MKSVPTSHIRNFSIIAHIDHGKSTLADRIIELTGGLDAREMKSQVLDDMDLERERGITIKAHSVRLKFKASDGQVYQFNIIDTPGHVDFNYEVSRSLKACEGALLIVDATQGVQAQTLANVYLAIDQDLEIIPVLNKIDLPNSDPERIKEQIEEIIGLPKEEVLSVSAKTGEGVNAVLEEVVKRIPPPAAKNQEPLQALVFDSWFNSYQGAIVLVRVFSGEIKVGDQIKFMSNQKNFEVLKLGCYQPAPGMVNKLSCGEVGFVIAGIKEIRDAQIGDTLTHKENPATVALTGFRKVKPMVFSGIYPVESSQYENLKDSLEKLKLNDSAFEFEPETSTALGFGFRCGFLGLLHMEIVQERLEREYDLKLINTSPTVPYQVFLSSGEEVFIESPALLPTPDKFEKICEPYIEASVHVPNEYVGAIIGLCESKRGIQKTVDYITQDRVVVVYEMPFPEIMFDFYDRLKSISRGYATIDYEILDYRRSDLVRLNILINGEMVDALSIIVHKDRAYFRGRELVAKLREIIPRQQYEVALQAAIGSRIVARETVKAMRKDVIAKCYGGDITRKRKLLEKQKEGKKRMKQVGHVEIPQEAFLAVLKIE